MLFGSFAATTKKNTQNTILNIKTIHTFSPINISRENVIIAKTIKANIINIQSKIEL
jgi:hypothetical protein